MKKINPLELFIIPAIINTVVGVSLFYLLPNYFWVVIGLLLLITLFYFVILYKTKFKAFREIGIEDVLFREKIPHIKDYEIKTNGDFAFWGISAKRFTNELVVLNKFKEIGNKGNNIRFLLLDPDCPNLAKKAIDEGGDPTIWKAEINLVIDQLKKFASQNNITIQIRLYSTFPVWRLVIMNSNLMYVTYFIKNTRQGVQSPLVKLIDDNYDNLYRAFKIQFEDVWENQSKIA